MLDSDRYWDCVDQASAAHQSGRADEALEWLDQALQHNPGGAEAYNGRGEILWDSGRCEEALQEFQRAIEPEPTFYPAHLNRVEILIEEFHDFEGALELCDTLLQGPLDGQTEAEIYYLKAKGLFYFDDLAGALFLLRRAIKKQGEVPVYRGFEGQILFELGQFEPALRSLERSGALEGGSAHTLHHTALCHEHLGNLGLADQYFEAASRLDGDTYPPPMRLDVATCEEAAAAAFQSLPEEIRRFVRNCPILIEDLPDRELIQKSELSPQIMGLFEGLPATAAGDAQRTSTDRIVLYRRNLEKSARSDEELVEQIQITVKHEVGHYLGLDEDEIERLGLG